MPARRSSRSWRIGLADVQSQQRIRVGSASELPVGSLTRVDDGPEPICVVHAEDGNFYAISDTCTHEEYSLSEGELWEMAVECPRHGSRFDVRTGRVTGLPAVIPARTYPVIVEGGDVFVEIGG